MLKSVADNVFSSKDNLICYLAATVHCTQCCLQYQACPHGATARETYSHCLLLQVPKECPEVPSKMLNPEEQWSNKGEFKDMLTHLAQLYSQNFNK